MDFNEIKTYFETNKENEEVKNFVGSFINEDRVNSFLETENGKKILQPKMDSFFSKGLETWKTNNLTKIVDDEVKKKTTNETPEQKMIRELQERLDAKEKAEAKANLVNKATKTASEKKLPVELVDFFLGHDEETTNKNLQNFETIFKKHVDEMVNERVKKNGYTPSQTANSSDDIKSQFEKALMGR